MYDTTTPDYKLFSTSILDPSDPPQVFIIESSDKENFTNLIGSYSHTVLSIIIISSID